MRLTTIHLVYFSATFTTRKIARMLAETFGLPVIQHDITREAPDEDIVLDKPGDLLIAGVPVYAGRVPALASDALRRFKGHGTPAIAVCVYGNRDYDDALLELKDIIEDNGFKTIAAGAFVAQHSIFPQVGNGRPDTKDELQIKRFAHECQEKLASVEDPSALSEPKVKGHKPYKKPQGVPLHPEGDADTCTRCGTCAKECPTHAIPLEKPYKTDGKRCISCGHCIAICPQRSRRYTGLLYKTFGGIFAKSNSKRKEPEWFL